MEVTIDDKYANGDFSIKDVVEHLSKIYNTQAVSTEFIYGYSSYSPYYRFVNEPRACRVTLRLEQKPENVVYHPKIMECL